MKYYATDGVISQQPIEGGIEISREQYLEALAGMAQGHVITIDDGFAVGPKPEPEKPEPELPTPKPEPTQVTRRQAKIYLHRQGLLDAVESALDELDEPMKTEGRIEWEEALTFDRANPLIAMIASVMEWSESELDEMYIEANKI